jgi:hypothetical protein
MAERFGGKHSPDGSVHRDHGPAGNPQQPGSRPRSPINGRVKIYMLTPLPFAVRAFTGDASGIIPGLSATAFMALAVWLTIEGIRAADAYQARSVARRPAFPRKISASVLTGTGLALGGVMAGATPLQSAGFFIFGVILHLLAFGPDPLKNKGMEGLDDFQTDRVARAIDEAEAYLAAMKDAVLRANDRGIEARVEKFAATARAMFRTIEGDPGDLTPARKYITVYLMGARDAAVKFADLYGRTRDPVAKEKFESLLTDLETQFAARTATLLDNNRDALDVEIKVLQERLLREG